VDVLVNNSGLMPLSPLDALKVDVNIKGDLYGIAAALPRIREQHEGQIVTLVCRRARRFPQLGRLLGDQVRRVGHPRGPQRTPTMETAVHRSIAPSNAYTNASRTTRSIWSAASGVSCLSLAASVSDPESWPRISARSEASRRAQAAASSPSSRSPSPCRTMNPSTASRMSALCVRLWPPAPGALLPSDGSASAPHASDVCQ
jgi:NAD(P)-dependent dehydrogenase (short-subunit alcohol dehydrogenase family)